MRIITVKGIARTEKIGKVAITIRSFDLQSPSMEKLRKNCDVVYINSTGHRLSENELCSILHDVEGVIAGTEEITEVVMRESGKLKVISRVGVGLDSIDLEYAKKQHILVKNTPESPAISVAEHTVALIFSLIKNIPQYNFQVRNSDFTVRPASNLCAKKVGIIGLGRIGSRVATILECTGCKILFFDPFVKSDMPTSWNRMDTLEALMADSDIVTIHSTAYPSEKPLIEEKLLSHAKKGIIIINTARGSLIDEHALITSLENGQVAAAGFDVFSVEPYKGDLLKFSQVIVTPHVGSNTIEARMQMEEEAVNNLIKGLKVRS